MKSFLNKAMKINFLVLMGLFFIPLTSHAQEEDNNPLRKGRIFTDFDFGLHSSDTNLAHETFVSDITAENSSVDIDALIGYTVLDNLVVGMNIFVERDHNTTNLPDVISLPGTASTSTLNSTSASYTLNARYFIGKNDFKPFIGAGFGLATYSEESIETGLTTFAKGTGTAFNTQLGASYFINDHIGFEFMYNYSSSSIDLENDVNFNGTLVAQNNTTKTNTSAFMAGVIVVF